ncbi:MAG: hypothetical protein KBF99_12745 [Leptospiraceae bacterium]|nr:hypothetical protein [Leptospiraceae bacterium]
MKKYFLVGLILLAVNCAKTEYYLKNVNHKVRLTSYTEEEGYKLKRRFDLSHTRVNMFWGIFRVYNKDLERILIEEFKNPETEAVGNLTITETYDLVDSLADLFTLGIVRLYSVKINGDLYEKVSLPMPMPNLPDALENPNQEKVEVKEEPMNEDTPKTESKEETTEKKQNKKEKGKTNAKKK